MYSDADVQSVKVTQRPVINLQDKVAYGVMKVLRTTFDAATGYGTPAHLTKAKYLNVRTSAARGGRVRVARGGCVPAATAV